MRAALQRFSRWLLVGLVVLVAMDAARADEPPATAAPYRAALIRAAHAQWGLDAPIAALAAQVHQESGWRPQAVSRVGARGLAQFMPATATWWCDLHDLALEDCRPENPTWALRALVGYDRWLYERAPARYGQRDRMWVALRAYNGGLGHWQAEARAAPGGLQGATREGVDAACGRAKRHPDHCPENLGYPRRVLDELQRRYLSWGPKL